MTYISWSSDFFSYILKITWWINVALAILIQCDTNIELKLYSVGQWPIFHGPVILPYILKTIWWTNVIIGILGPWDAKIYLIKCMWVSNLHFRRTPSVFLLQITIPIFCIGNLYLFTSSFQNFWTYFAVLFLRQAVEMRYGYIYTRNLQMLILFFFFLSAMTLCSKTFKHIR